MKIFNHISQFLKEYLDIQKISWKAFTGGLITALVLIAIIFSIPLKTVTIETTKTESTVEIKEEPYSALEPYIIFNNNNNTNILINGFYKVIPNGVHVPFQVDKPNTRIFGHFENSIPGRFAILGIGDRVIWETMGSHALIDIILQPGDYKAMFKEDVMWGEDCYIFLAQQWSDSQPVIKYREVIRYKETTIPVEKQQIVLESKKISMWNYLLFKSPLIKSKD